MIGDCDNCSHSFAYHVPIMGCLKCDCDEFKRFAIRVIGRAYVRAGNLLKPMRWSSR